MHYYTLFPNGEQNMNSSKHLKKSAFFRRALFSTTGKILLAAIILISVLANLFTFLTPVVKYYGTGMAPTLEDGQILVVSKVGKIKNGDIIAFYYNNKVLVRRVIATENQQISIDLYGQVSINGEPLEEPYIENKTLGQCNQKFPLNVPVGSYFVMGDHREAAMDSRLEEIGTVDEDRLIGKVLFSLHPMRGV